MYEKIVESSRFCAMGYNGACDGCIFCGNSNDKDGECYQQLHKAAADAIEEEDMAFRRLERDYKELCAHLPKWISVTEHLPKTRESILGKKSDKVIVAFRFNDGTQGADTAHTLNGEWVFEDHITVVARTITHWMPLPEPPKEET